MDESKTFKTGVSFQAIGLGAFFAALAAGAGLAGAAGIYLRFRRIPIPSWAFYLAATVFLLIAIYAVKLGLEATFCRVCKVATAGGDAYFPLELEDEVMNAARTGNIQALLPLPLVKKNQMKMHIWAAYCPNCGQFATMDVTRWKDYRPTTLMEDVAVTGASARALVDLIGKHENWRARQPGG